MNTDTTSQKLEKANLTTWSLMNSGRRMVTKIGFLPFLRGPVRLRKLRQISESPKRHWISVPWSFSFAVFDPKTKTNFEGETLYRAPISVTPSNSRIRKISDSRTFLWVSSEHTKWPSNDFSLIRAECHSSRDLRQTPLVRELFKPAEFGSRFSSGARLQSSSKGNTKLSILFLTGCWLAVSSELFDCWLSECSAPIKSPTVAAVLILVALGCCRISFGWRFALFCGGCYIIDFIVHVSSYFLQSTFH